MPAKGACTTSRVSSSSARVTAASAARMPLSALWIAACAASTPAAADSTAASALETLAAALAARVSEPKPLSLSRLAALPSIRAALSAASASAWRARATGSPACASGRRACASSSRASASASADRRGPASISHSTWPSETSAPARSGSEMTRPEVSADTTTCRSASVRPRSTTAFSVTCASDRRTTTWTPCAASSWGAASAAAAAPALSSGLAAAGSIAGSAGPNRAAKSTSLSRSRITKYKATQTSAAVMIGKSRILVLVLGDPATGRAGRQPTGRPRVSLGHCRVLR